MKMDHLVLLLGDLRASLPYYDTLLPLLGFTLTRPHDYVNEDGLHIDLQQAGDPAQLVPRLATLRDAELRHKLRYGLLRDSNLIAKKLCDNDRVVCAAPAYVARAGQPDSVEALAGHNCICFYRNGELFNQWQIFHQGQTREVRVSGDRAADDGAMVRKWTVDGHGIAYKSRLDVARDLQAGRLVDLFPDARCEQVPLYAVYPSRQYQPARLQSLLQFLQEAFQGAAGR